MPKPNKGNKHTEHNANKERGGQNNMNIRIQHVTDMKKTHKEQTRRHIVRNNSTNIEKETTQPYNTTHNNNNNKQQYVEENTNNTHYDNDHGTH